MSCAFIFVPQQTNYLYILSIYIYIYSMQLQTYPDSEGWCDSAWISTDMSQLIVSNNEVWRDLEMILSDLSVLDLYTI